MNSFGDFLLYAIYIFFFAMYLMALFFILTDLFRDHELSGWWKALWILALFVIPFLSMLAYVIFRGPSMAKRAQAAAQRDQEATVAVARQIVAQTGGPQGGSATDQITQAKSLLDSGAITQAEFDQIKAKALS
ncbi:MAG: SHOCT domain-containing protein [Candidatus Nanopelagicales bacterium]